MRINLCDECPQALVSYFGNSEANFTDTNPLFSVACCSLKLVGIQGQDTRYALSVTA